MTKRCALAMLMALAACKHTELSGRLFGLAEVTEGGMLRSYPAEASVVDADPNSAVRIEPSEAALRVFMTQRSSDPALVGRLRALAALQEQLNRSLEKLRAAAESARVVRERGSKATPAERAAFLASYSRFADLKTAVDAYAERIGQKAALDTRVAEQGGSPELYRDWVGEQYATAEEQLTAAAESDGHTLELAAWIGRPASQVHVPGYDSLTPGLAHEVDKMKFATVPPEEMEAAQAVSRAIATSNNFKSAATKAVEEAKSKLAATQTELSEKLATMFAAAEQQTKPELAQLKLKAADAKASCAEVLQKIETVARRTSPQSSTAPDPAASLNILISSLGPAGASAKRCGQLLVATRQVAETLAQNASTEIKEVGIKLRDAVDAALAQLAHVIGWATDAEVASIPELRTFAVQLSSARPTEVSLLETERKEGDVLTIRARIFEPDGKTIVPGGESTRYVRIRARPFVADTGAAVLWVRGVRHDPGPFLTGAGAYAVVRFTGWRENGEAGSPFFHLLAPGLGIAAILIPQASDGSNKLAWMGTAQLFGDVLQVALGITLDGSPAWGFGVGLHRLAGVGKYFQ